LCKWRYGRFDDPSFEHLLAEIMSFLDIMMALEGQIGYGSMWDLDTVRVKSSDGIMVCWAILARLAKEALYKIGEEATPPTMSFAQMKGSLDRLYYDQ
jgi:hypothetical protein